MRGKQGAGGGPGSTDLLLANSAYNLTSSNARSFRDRALTSITIGGDTYQAVAFWNENGSLVLGKRVRNSDSWTLYTYDGTAGLPLISVVQDFHNVANIGFDPAGYLHVVYDVHDSNLKYRKSSQPVNSWTGGLSGTQAMLGTNETSVTYPTFINDPSGALYFFFRNGMSGSGDNFLYRYDHQSQAWTAAAGTGTGGKVISGVPDDLSFYWLSAPTFDADFGSGGFLHFAGWWRDLDAGAGGDHDVTYFKWDGSNFYKSNGAAQTIPVTIANCEIVDPVPVTNLGLYGQPGMDTDAAGHPHLCYPKWDANGYQQIYHAYHNGAAWTIQALTSTDVKVSNTQESCSPELVMDRTTGAAYVLYRQYNEAAGLYALKSGAGNYSLPWSRVQLVDFDVRDWSPNYDRERWLSERVLDLPVMIYRNGIAAADADVRLVRVDPAAAQAADPVPEIITAGLVARYKFDERSGQVLTDRAGAYHGELGATAAGGEGTDPTWNTQGLSFDGGDYLRIDSPVLDIHNSPAYTISFVIKMAAAGLVDRKFFSLGNGSEANTTFSLGSGPSGQNQYLKVFIKNASPAVELQTNSTIAAFDNTWRTITFRDDNGSWSMFVDGQPAGSGSYTKAAKTITRATIGALRRTTVADWISGQIAYALFYNVALSDADISHNRDVLRLRLLQREITLP